MFLFLFLFCSMLLLCSFFRLKELFQVKNGLTTSLLFFFENAKNLGRSDDAKRRNKKRMALSAVNEHLFHLLIKSWLSKGSLSHTKY